jgi:6,7-dimethyl-8-ribityllumazine synthase
LKVDLDAGSLRAEGFRFAILVSRWNSSLTSRLAEGALRALEATGAAAADIESFNVPGAFELPLASLKAAQTGRFDAVIALGVVIRGDTPHFEYIAREAAAGISRASLDTGVPVAFGVITADNLEQAEARSGPGADNKGYEAALAAIEMADLIRSMQPSTAIDTDSKKVLPHVV